MHDGFRSHAYRIDRPTDRWDLIFEDVSRQGARACKELELRILQFFIGCKQSWLRMIVTGACPIHSFSCPNSSRIRVSNRGNSLESREIFSIHLGSAGSS